MTEKSFYKKLGKVTKIVGLTIESAGPDAKLNDLCKIYSADRSQVSIMQRWLASRTLEFFLCHLMWLMELVREVLLRILKVHLAVKVGDDILRTYT